MCNCDGERMEVTAYRSVKARKRHTCCECKSEISPGEEFDLFKWLYEGTWYQVETCLPCLAVSRLFQEVYDGCAGAGELYQELIDCEVIGVSGKGNDRLYYSTEEGFYVMTQNPLRVRVKEVKATGAKL